MLRKKTNYLNLRCDTDEGSSGKGRRVNLGGLKFEVNAEGAKNFLYLFLGSCAWVDVSCPKLVDREGLWLDDVAEGGKGGVTIGNVEVSDRREDILL
jgi:hypothetical protein